MSLKVLVVSDLHIEFNVNFKIIPENYSGCDMIIIAGDLAPIDKARIWLSEQKFEIPVLYVLGNHEYYGFEYDSGYFNGTVHEIGKIPNVTVFDKYTRSVEINNHVFIGVTLWTNLNSIINQEFYPKPYINDILQISGGDSICRFTNYNERHKSDLNALVEEIKKYDRADKKIHIITHHSPSYVFMENKYIGSEYNPYFQSHLDYLFKCDIIDTWIFGHTHRELDIMYEGIRVISAPLGYPNEKVNKNFKFKIVNL